MSPTAFITWLSAVSLTVVFVAGCGSGQKPPPDQTAAAGGADTANPKAEAEVVKPPPPRLRNTIGLGHYKGVYGLAFSRNGTRMATGSNDRLVRIWDMATRQVTSQLGGHAAGVQCVAFSPDGKLLASGGEDKTVKLWSVETGFVQETLTDHSDVVRTLAFSPDGGTLASAGDDGSIQLWNVARKKSRKPLTSYNSPFLCLAFSSDGTLLAAGSKDKLIRLWDLATGEMKVMLEGYGAEVTSVEFSRDGKSLLSAGRDDTVRLWNIATRESRTLFKGRVIRTAAFGPDETRLAVVDQNAEVIDVASGKIAAEFEMGWRNGIETPVVTCGAFAPAANVMVAGYSEGGIVFWDVGQKEKSAYFDPGHTEQVRSIAFTTDGDTLISGSYDTTLRAWNPTNGRMTAWLKIPAAVNSVCIQDNGLVVAGTIVQDLVSWDRQSGSSTPGDGSCGGVNSVAKGPNGALAWACNDKTVRLGTKVLKGHTAQVWEVAFQPGGSLLASSGVDKSIRLWDSVTGEEKGVLDDQEAVRALAFSRDGALLFSGGEDKTVKVWDVGNRKLVDTLKGHEWHVECLALSSDGSLLASGGDHTIRLWEVATRKPIAVIDVSARGNIHCLAFHPAGELLASAGTEDGAIRIWELKPKP